MEEIDKLRREFLDPCDFAVSVPVTWCLEGDNSSSEAVVIPLFRMDVGIIAKKNEDYEIKLRFAGSESKILGLPAVRSPGSLNFAEEFFIKLNVLASDKMLQLSPGTLRKLKKCECRIWVNAPYQHAGFNLIEDISTALAFLVFCLENKISPEKQEREKDGIKSIIKPPHENPTDLADLFKQQRRRLFLDLFKFCWKLQSYTNGASCFVALLGTPEFSGVKSPGSRECFGYRLSYPDIGNILMEMWKNSNPMHFALLIDRIFDDGAIKVNYIHDPAEAFDVLLAHSEDKKDKILGPVLLPFFFDEISEVNLTVEASKEKLKRRFSWVDNYLEFFAPTSVIRNVKDELNSLQKSKIIYSSDTLYAWDFRGANILDKKEYKLPGSPKGKITVIGEKPEEGKAEINFTETEVQVSGQNPLSKDNPLILAEYIILKEKVHWLWAFVILPEFETKRPKWQFRNYVSKKRIILKKYGIKITALKKAEDDYAKFEGIENKVKSNVQDVKGYYNKSISLFKEHKLGDAINELNKIATSYYKWYSFTNAYLTLIEWIRMENFEGIAEGFITNCRDFLSWYIKRLQIGISRIEFYKKWLLKNKNKLDELAEQEFQKIKDELKNVEENLQALVQKVPLSKEDKEYEIFVRFLIDTQEKLMFIQEQEAETEETRQEACIQVVIELQKENKSFDEIVKNAFKVMGNELYRLDKSKTYSDKILRDESREIYWLVCELILDLKNFDEIELNKGNKLGMLMDYFNKGTESKIKKWLSGALDFKFRT